MNFMKCAFVVTIWPEMAIMWKIFICKGLCCVYLVTVDQDMCTACLIQSKMYLLIDCCWVTKMKERLICMIAQCFHVNMHPLHNFNDILPVTQSTLCWNSLVVRSEKHRENIIIISCHTHAVCSGGHSNTSAVHVRDQRFSKHTLNAIFSLQEKHPLNENFAWFCSQIYP